MVQQPAFCIAMLSLADLTCCQVYDDEKEGEAEAGERAGRAGGRHTFHEVGDVHVGDGAEVNLPTGLRTVVGMLQAASVSHEVSVGQLALALHQAAVEPVHGVRGDGLRVVVAREVVMQVPDWPLLQLGLGQGEGKLTVVQYLGYGW